MSCDFKPGDEVVCVTANLEGWGVAKDGVYVISDLCPPDAKGRPGVRLRGFPLPGVPLCIGFSARCFRKVERRNDKLNLTEWLAQPTEVEEPKRAPAKKRERV